MGRALIQSIGLEDGLHLASLWLREPASFDRDEVSSRALLSDDIDKVAAAAEVLIDFSLPEATDAVLAAVLRHETPLVIGVSGLGDDQQPRLDAAARRLPLVFDRNMSLGIAVLEELVSRAARSLGRGFDVTVHETHHVHKLDAPSGTALKLGEAIAEARGQDFAAVRWYEPDAAGRDPVPGDIRFEALRRGEVPGDHSVVMSSATESLTLQHSVTTRQVFAEGALRAARWVRGQKPGRYTMRDVLFAHT